MKHDRVVNMGESQARELVPEKMQRRLSNMNLQSARASKEEERSGSSFALFLALNPDWLHIITLSRTHNQCECRPTSAPRLFRFRYHLHMSITHDEQTFACKIPRRIDLASLARSLVARGITAMYHMRISCFRSVLD